MSYSGDAAEQVVRMSLEGTEVAVKLAGKGAKEIALLLYAVLKDQKKTSGKMRLTNMLRSGKELKVFAVQDKDLARFCKEAKKYGVLYCVLKDRDANDGITDVMVRAEDSSKVNRIFERFELTTVDMATVRSEIERAKAQRSAVAEEKEEPELATPQRSKEDIFLDALMANPSREEAQTANPTEGRVAKSNQSGTSSRGSSRGSTSPLQGQNQSPNREEQVKRPSVRQELREIRAELDDRSKGRGQTQKSPEHHAPKKKHNKKKERF